MSYTLNGTDLSTLGVIEGQAPKSNIALSGHWNLPKRIGQLDHSWAEDHSVQAYVDADELFFDGREILFYANMFGERPTLDNNLFGLNALIDGLTDLVTFSTPYGDFSVYVKKMTSKIYNGAYSLIFTFREPIVTLSGGSLPSTSSDVLMFDGIPFLSFGLYLEKHNGLYDLSNPKEQFVTKYGAEGYQITNRTGNELILKTTLISTSLNDLQSKILNLYLLFSSADERVVTIDDIAIDCFATKGFTINNIIRTESGYVAIFTINLIVTNVSATAYITEDAGDDILTTEDDKIIIYGT